VTSNKAINVIYIKSSPD